MSKKQVRDLERLERSDFTDEEYAALAWVRAFLTYPEGVPEEVEAEFRDVLEPEEVLSVMAAMKGMFMANLSVNTYRVWGRRLLGMPEIDEGAACRLDLEPSDDGTTAGSRTRE